MPRPAWAVSNSVSKGQGEGEHLRVTITSGYTLESLAHLYSSLYLSLSFRLSPFCSRVWLLASLCGFASLGLYPCLSDLTTVTLFLPPGSLLCALFSLCYFIFLSSFILWLSSLRFCVSEVCLCLLPSPQN